MHVCIAFVSITSIYIGHERKKKKGESTKKNSSELSIDALQYVPTGAYYYILRRASFRSHGRIRINNSVSPMGPPREFYILLLIFHHGRRPVIPNYVNIPMYVFECVRAYIFYAFRLLHGQATMTVI